MSNTCCKSNGCQAYKRTGAGLAWGRSHKATQNVSALLVLALLLAACSPMSVPRSGQLLAQGQEVSMQADWAGSPPELQLSSPRGLGWVELALPPLPQGLRLRFVGVSALESLQLAGAGQVWQCRSDEAEFSPCAGAGLALRLQRQPQAFVVELPAELLQQASSWRLQWVDYWR